MHPDPLGLILYGQYYAAFVMNIIQHNFEQFQTGMQLFIEIVNNCFRVGGI